MSADPLILTLDFHAEDQLRFDRLRQAHFPAALNLVPAHVTLFHHLPGDDLSSIEHLVRLACATQEPFEVSVTGLRSLGRGVAYVLEATPLARLRSELGRAVHDRLTPQDRQPYRPHLTIQNKVQPVEARALLGQMQAEFAAFTVRACGLVLWHYRGGPWEPASRHRFAG